MKDNREELLSLANKAVAYAEKRADHVEVLVQDNYEISCEVNIGEMNKATQVQESGVAIRCVMGQRIGSAFTNRLEWKSIEQAVKNAILAAKASTPDETWKNLPKKRRYAKLSDVWDDSIPDKDPGEFVDLTSDLTKRIVSHGENIIVGQAGTGAVYGWNAYANSNGIGVSDRATIAYAFAALVAPTPTGMTPGVTSIDVKRSFNIDIDYIVESSVHDVILAKKPAKGKTELGVIIMDANTLGELFLYTLVPAISGENVVRGRSALAKRIGEKIGTKNLSIIDDGLHPGAFNTHLFDGEGVPHQTTPILENGRLVSFLWDSYWGHRQGEKSTGNASRNLRTGLVNIQPTNILIPPGKVSLEDLISDVKSGYFVKGLQGAHSSNQDTGDFSVVGNPAYRIEDGKLIGCCQGLMLAGNIFKFIQHVDCLGTDVRGQLIEGPCSIVAPSIRFTDVQVVAKAD
ncbi:MAG: TldD/PmbA family protein [Promethearchaeota archaeon]